MTIAQVFAHQIKVKVEPLGVQLTLTVKLRNDRIIHHVMPPGVLQGYKSKAAYIRLRGRFAQF